MQDVMKFKNKIGLPEEVVAVIERSITTEYASLTKAGAPITYPVTPYFHSDGMSLSVSTGVTYPSKAERARNNPHVSLLYSDPVGIGIDKPAIVQVFGHGFVRDSDIQGNTDRYIQLSAAKLPDTANSTPRWIQKRMKFYYSRIWIEVLPLRVLWWSNGDLTSKPQEWCIDPSMELPVSDPKPAPMKQKHEAFVEQQSDWHKDLQLMLAEITNPVLTTVYEGYPIPMRVLNAKLENNQLVLTLPHTMKFAENSPACLTFHEHDATFSFQQNRLFKGTVTKEADKCIFTVSEQLGDWSLKGSPLAVMFDFFSKGRKLNKRLKAEVERRGQSVPELHF